MAELIRNKRFRTGNKVDIHFDPVFEGYTKSITDSTVGGAFQIVCEMNVNVSGELFGIGDIMALSFGCGEITQINGDDVTVSFPNSMFPDTNIMRFIGRESQHVLVFLKNDRKLVDMQVNRYSDDISTATFGYAKAVYDISAESRLLLAPLKRVDDGLLAKLMMSKGYVLKACDDDNYTVETNTWYGDFPIELSGSSIDPIYRRAFMIKRQMRNKSNKARATMEFKLIG